MELFTSAIVSSIISTPISILINLLSSKIEESEIYNQPVAQQLWKRFFDAFYNSFKLIAQDNLGKYQPDQIATAAVIKKELKRYVSDSNYLPLITIFQKFSNQNFDSFLFNLRNDDTYNFKKTLSEKLYIELDLATRIPDFPKETVTAILVLAFQEYYETFLSTLNNKDQQRLIVEEIYTSRQEIETFQQLCLEALNKLIESAPSTLSLEIFKNLSKKNLTQYLAQEFPYLKIVVDREEELNIFHAISNSTKPLIFLSGKSGVGKSLVCLKALRFFSKDDYALWLSAKNIEKAGSLEQAILFQLKELKAEVQFNYADFFKLFEQKKLYLVVDDVNRMNDTDSVIRKLVSWSIKSKDESLPPFSIICPIWERKHQSFIRNSPQAKNKSQEFSISFFSKFDAKTLINKGLNFNALEHPVTVVEKLAKNLYYDPFLIGLFVDLLETENQHILALSQKPLQLFFQKYISEIAKNTDYLEYEVANTLKKLAEQILNRKQFTFDWQGLEKWFITDKKTLKILRLIGKNGSFFRVNDETGEIQFRHDRIKDKLLVDQLSIWTQEENIIDTVFDEVYFDELFSQAITQSPVSDSILSYFSRNNPTVLFESIKYLNNCSSAYQFKIITLIKQWIQNDKQYQFIKEPIDEILARTISPYVLEITNTIDYENDMLLQLARLGNGDIVAGLKYIDKLPNNTKLFLPATYQYQYTALKKYIETAKAYYGQICENTLAELLDKNNFGQDSQKYIIQLIGIFRYDSLGEKVFEFWKKSTNKEDLLSSVIWALSICYKVKFSSFIKELLAFWVSIYDKEEDLNSNRVYQDLRKNVVWENILSNTIEEILTWGDLAYPASKLSMDILLLLDEPRIVSALCENEQFLEGALKDVFKYHNSNNKNNRYAWLIVSKSPKTGKDVNRNSLAMFVNSAQLEDLPYLRKIHFDFYQKDGELFEKIAWKRLKLNDNNLRNDLITYLPELLVEDLKWCYFLPPIWNEEIWAILLPLLNMDSFENFAQMSVHLSRPQAEVVLCECWKLVHQHQNFSLLNDACKEYIDSHHTKQFYTLIRKYRNLAQATLITISYQAIPYLDQLIKHLERPNPIFGRFHSHLHSNNEMIGFNSMSIINRTHLRIDQLEILSPYVKYFEQHPYTHNYQANLDKLAEFALAGRNYEWAFNHVYPYLKTMIKGEMQLQAFHQIYLDVIPEGKDFINADLKYIYFPTNAVIIKEFNEYVEKGWFGMVSSYWIDSFKKRRISLERFFHIIMQFLLQKNHIKAFTFAAKCIEVSGTRKELRILKDFKGIKEAEGILLKTEFVVKKRSLL